MRKIFMGIFVLLLSFNANAADGPRAYLAVGGGLLTFDDGFDKINPLQVFGRFGYDFNANIGVGGELGISLVDDSVGPVDYSVTTTFFYVKGTFPIQPDASVYVMAGPTNVELTGEAFGISASADDDDMGIGFGFQKEFGKNAFSIDYVNYYDDDGIDVFSINLGYVIFF